MKHKIGKAVAALVFSVGMVGMVATAHAGEWTMAPAWAGLPRESGHTFSMIEASVVANDPGGMYWMIPAPNNTGLSSEVAWIDFGTCQGCAGLGVATDYAGDIVALTGSVDSAPYPTSQYVTFGSGFNKTYAYITYEIYLTHNGMIHGVEYYEF